MSDEYILDLGWPPLTNWIKLTVSYGYTNTLGGSYWHNGNYVTWRTWL